VPFTLKVTEGPGAGEEFSFEGGEAKLGRTADNDVVLKDPSSSRSHARVIEEDGLHFIEDLKSANGTQVNGKPVKGRRPIATGDRITIGDVVIEFEAPAANDTMMAPPSATMDEDSEEPLEDPNATVLKPPSRPSSAIKRVPPRQAPTSPPEDEAAGPLEDEPASEAGATKDFEVPPPRALQRRQGGTPARASRAVESQESVELSAAERARQRRELQKSTAGRAQLLWNDLPRPARFALGGVGAVVGLLVLGLAVWAVVPKKVVRKNEPMALRPNGPPIVESFGEGEGVDFPRRDLKSFTFSYLSPTPIVGVLHYQARDISKEEVTIELNGNALGFVPPDTIDSQTRQIELVLPTTMLRIEEPNELVFDNVGNPPGDDPWRVWNIWVEIIPVPQMSPEQAERRAKEDIERSAKQYEMREVGAMNLFRAWKGYRDAWLLLEATPGRPQELLQLARMRMNEIRPELDRKCAAMLVDYQKAMNLKVPDLVAARAVLTHISEHFEKEHQCFSISRNMLKELDSIEEPE
jgi:pSer/pThr/pTyr-binding forkhead associated (FHA) protein